MVCQNLTFSSSNFRTTELQDNIAYIDALPKELEDPNFIDMLNDKQNALFSLFDITLWDKYAPQSLTETDPHCKKCFLPSILCDQAIEAISGTDRCDGKLIKS